MFPYKKYLIHDSDSFSPDNYPQVTEDIANIRMGISHLPDLHKAEMLIAYAKDQCIARDLTSTNPDLASLIISMGLPTANLVSLFDSADGNLQFRDQLERYLKSCLHKNPVPAP